MCVWPTVHIHVQCTCGVSDQSLMTAIVRVYSKFVQKFLTKLILAQVQTEFNCMLFEIPSKWAGSYCYCNQSTWSMIFDIFQLVQNIWTLYKTWAERLVKVSHTCTCSWDSTWIECRGLTKAYEPNSWPFLAAIRKQKLLKFDAIGHHLWAALAPKIAEVECTCTHLVLMSKNVHWC